ncbi:hypothetical protein V496_10276 [Pseudogymnoascus sp. VKM F-4515 (FW-2607)]|nr:hypothetical protein V496_10276 [Pseudogymnoascus sp. VKM F-4515 (FW-2607)]
MNDSKNSIEEEMLAGVRSLIVINYKYKKIICKAVGYRRAVKAVVDEENKGESKEIEEAPIEKALVEEDPLEQTLEKEIVEEMEAKEVRVDISEESED